MKNSRVPGPGNTRRRSRSYANPARNEKSIGKGTTDSHQIEIVRRSRPGRLSDRKIRQVIGHVLRRHKIRLCELEVAVLGSAAMATLNRRWLGHEGATDAIAFDLGDEPASRSKAAIGQINVCWPVARKQATRRGHAAETELLLYVVHALLHLLGYDDHDPKEAVRMHGQEDEMFEELGFGSVYSAGSN